MLRRVLSGRFRPVVLIQLPAKLVGVLERFGKNNTLDRAKQSKDTQLEDVADILDAESVFNQLVQWSEDDHFCVALCTFVPVCIECGLF